MQTIFTNESYFYETLEKIKSDWLQNLHILADFDRTLTKAVSFWKVRWSLISVLRSEWYLSEEYTKKAYELFDVYHPIEINPNISIVEKSKEMTTWWNKHLELLVKSKLNKSHIDQVINGWLIELRPWIKDFLHFLSQNNIPVVIISANWLWTDSIKLYFENLWILTPNINIISNSFFWDKDWFATWYDKRVIHVFNKDETVLSNFPEIYQKIKNRKNVILLWDSLWDPWIIEGFEYDNLLKFWFLNEKEDELLSEYKKHYDVILTWDNDSEIIANLFK